MPPQNLPDEKELSVFIFTRWHLIFTHALHVLRVCATQHAWCSVETSLIL
jgi:hypothetical protein